jgi:hypothetical protein
MIKIKWNLNFSRDYKISIIRYKKAKKIIVINNSCKKNLVKLSIKLIAQILKIV